MTTGFGPFEDKSAFRGSLFCRTTLKRNNSSSRENLVNKEVDYPVLDLHIFQAIERGDLSTIKKWIKEDPTRVNECRGGSKFPRLFAVANGTVLHWAVYYGQLEIAQVLLDNGADPYEEAQGGETVLHWACQTKIQNEKLFQLLLDHGKSKPKELVNIQDRARGMTPLHYACSDGNKERMEQLLLAGADLTLRDHHHATPKDRLDEDGQAYQELAALLDKYHPQNTNRQDSTSGATGQVFRSRVEVDCGDVLDEVQVCSSDAQDKVTELKQHIIEAIKKGETSTIKEWLQSEGTKANEYRGGRAFPRHHAVADGTALHWAVYYGQLEITQLLLDNGADSHRRAEGGETVLHWACQSKIMNKELLKILFDIHVKTEHDAEPLVNVPDGARRMTPLHFACSDNNKELVPLLLEAGADPGLRDHYDATPKDWLNANEENYQAIATLLDKQHHKQSTGASHSSSEIDVKAKEVKYQPKK